MSTLTTGTLASTRVFKIVSKGARTVPEKENPKIASTTRGNALRSGNAVSTGIGDGTPSTNVGKACWNYLDNKKV